MQSVCFTCACPKMTRKELSTMAREKFEVKTSRLWRTKNLFDNAARCRKTDA